MNKKNWLIIGVVVLVAFGIYNQTNFGPIAECYLDIDGNEKCGGVLTPNPGTCPDGQKKCQSADRSNFICCASADSCGSAKKDDSNSGRSKAWCVPPSPTCPEGTTTCKASNKPGASTACCPTGYTCKTTRGTAWCSPNGPKQCPAGWSYAGCKKSNICCPTGAVAKCSGGWGSPSGWAYCDDSGNGCAAGQTACSDSCCNVGESCVDFGWGYGTCSPNSCPEEQELCSGRVEGYLVNICCDSGTCIPSTNGHPRCINEWPYTNPPPTPSTNPSTSPRVDESL